MIEFYLLIHRVARPIAVVAILHPLPGLWWEYELCDGGFCKKKRGGGRRRRRIGHCSLTRSLDIFRPRAAIEIHKNRELSRNRILFEFYFPGGDLTIV